MGHIEIPGALIRLHPHIGHALHIVLPTQWVHTTASSANVARDHSQIGNLHHGKRALVVLRYAKAMKGHGRIGGGVGDGSSAHLLSGNPRYCLQVIEIDVQNAVFECLETFGACFNKIFFGQTLFDDVIQHHIKHRDVGARTQLQMMGGVLGQLGPAWVNHNGGLALHGELLQFGPSNRVSLSWVGANDHDTIGKFNVLDGIGSRARAERTLHPDGRRRMAYSCTTVDVIGPDDGPDELLHQVIFFVGTTRRRNASNGVGPVFRADSAQFCCDKIVYFVPGYTLQLAISPDHGVLQTLGVLVKRKRVAPLQASMSLVHLGVPRGLNAEDAAVFNTHFEVAAYPTVGTHGADFILSHQGFGLIDIRNSRSWTSLGASTTGDTIRLEKALVKTLDDLAVETPTSHTQHQLALYLVASTYAAKTQNAL